MKARSKILVVDLDSLESTPCSWDGTGGVVAMSVSTRTRKSLPHLLRCALADWASGCTLQRRHSNSASYLRWRLTSPLFLSNSLQSLIPPTTRLLQVRRHLASPLVKRSPPRSPTSLREREMGRSPAVLPSMCPWRRLGSSSGTELIMLGMALV